MRDITLRALDVLRGAALVLCEDTRVTRKLLDRHQLSPKLFAYHDHNAASVRPRVLEALAKGSAVALVSDAGTPLVSDPGFKLVEAAIEAGHRVFPIPGASAALAALVSAGLPSDRFFFEGFLPPKSGARKTRLAELREIPATLIFYESGPRLADSLADMTTLGDTQRRGVPRIDQSVRGSATRNARRTRSTLRASGRAEGRDRRRGGTAG